MADTPLPQGDEADLKAAQNAFQEIDAGGKPVEEPAKPEVTPQPEAPKPEEKPEPPKEEKAEPKDEQPQRPERYIPVPKYQEEKKQWQEERTKLEGELETLRKRVETATTPAEAHAADERVKAWAEKRGMDYDAAKELIDIAREGMGLPQETLAVIQQAEAKAREQESQTRFNGEFDKDVTPLIRAEFPEASEQQIAAAKKVMDELAHTKSLAQTPLAYIFHGNKADFAELFTDKPGFERSKSTNSAMIKGSHFKGKKDFSSVLSLPEDERARVESEMDPQTAWAYYDYVEKQDSGVKISRQGQTIRLR